MLSNSRRLLFFFATCDPSGHLIRYLVRDWSDRLLDRDVDIAMNRVAAAIQDWAGGTRIGVCLEEFNRKWSRRLLGQNAVVLLINGPRAEGSAPVQDQWLRWIYANG